MARPARGAGRPAPTASEFDSWEVWYGRTDYRRMPWFSPRPSPWVVRAVGDRWIRRRSRVLDVGCGTGSNAIWLEKQGLRTAGVDVAPTAIAIATDRARRAGVCPDLRVASAAELPFGRGAFDVALDTGCFHSLPLRLREEYVRELARVLAPGGRVLLTWIPREMQAEVGPPHRPALEEVAAVFEPRFLFSRVERFDAGTADGWKVRSERYARCTARLVLRDRPQPPAR